MSQTLWWFKTYLKQLKRRHLGEKTDRDKDHVVQQYSTTGTRDLEFYFQDTPRECMVDGKITQCLAKTVRDFYIDQLSHQIEQSGATRVLEVGAGNSLNLYLLSQRFPNISFEGIDITPERVEVGKKWLKANKNFEPNIEVGDVTELAFADDEFDLIFSVHCFEQIDQYALAGVKEVCRVDKSKAVFLEPDYVNSNAAQRLFLKTHNYLVNFSKTIESVAPGKLEHTELNTYFNVKNKTGLFVINTETENL